MTTSGPPKLTRAKLTDTVRAELGLPRSVARRLVDDVFRELEGSLLSGETVKLSGFGSFEIQSRPARPGRNPATMEPHTVPARQVVQFRPSQRLREALNPEPAT